MGQGRRETIPCGCEGHRTLTRNSSALVGCNAFPQNRYTFLGQCNSHFFTHLQNTVLLLQKRECSRFPPFSQPQAGHSQHYKCHDYNTGKKPQRTCYYGTEQVGTPFSPPPLYKNISLKQQHAPSPFCNLNARNFNSLQPSEGKLTQGLLSPYPMSREGKGNGRSSCMKHGCARQHMQN